MRINFDIYDLDGVEVVEKCHFDDDNLDLQSLILFSQILEQTEMDAAITNHEYIQENEELIILRNTQILMNLKYFEDFLIDMLKINKIDQILMEDQIRVIIMLIENVYKKIKKISELSQSGSGKKIDDSKKDDDLKLSSQFFQIAKDLSSNSSIIDILERKSKTIFNLLTFLNTQTKAPFYIIRNGKKVLDYDDPRNRKWLIDHGYE